MNSTDKNRRRLESPDWEKSAPVALRTHGSGYGVARKVLTNGIGHINLTNSQMENLTKMLRSGKEVRFRHDGEDLWRMYPCADVDLKTMFVATMTMGDFRRDVYKGKRLRFTSESGKRDLKAEDVDRIMSEAAADRAEREHVSPETVVVCPQCGYEFKVGKSLE